MRPAFCNCRGYNLKEGEERGFGCEKKEGATLADLNEITKKCCEREKQAECKIVMLKGPGGDEYNVCVSPNPDEFALKMYFCCNEKGAAVFATDRKPADLQKACK